MSNEENIEQGQEDRKTESPKEQSGVSSQESGGEAVALTEATNQTSAINTSEIKTMEVHHHPQLEKKSFKEYVLEGLMIFLAVTMGFFAENIRENITDNEKEKVFIESFVEDLEADQKYFEEQGIYFTERLEQLDSLIILLNTKERITNTNDFYYYGRLAVRYTPVVLHTGTIDEVKNSGGLRLIRKKGLPKKLVEYYNQLPIIKEYEARLMSIDEDYRRTFIDIIDPSALESNYSKIRGRVDKHTDNPPLRNYSKDDLAKLFGYAQYMRTLRSVIAGSEEDLKKNGQQLLALIQKEYHLKHE